MNDHRLAKQKFRIAIKWSRIRKQTKKVLGNEKNYRKIVTESEIIGRSVMSVYDCSAMFQQFQIIEKTATGV